MVEQVIHTYQCPACTGPLHFGAGSGKLECEYCGSSYEVAQIEALYAEKASEPKLTCPACDAVGTVVHTAVDGVYAGYIVISDEVKAGAAEAVAALRRAGVKKTVMLTGDNEGAARAVAEAVGVDEVHSRLLPEDKVTAVEALLQSSRGKLAFVGDGVNDAPVLSRADVGIAMGALGSDAAIEAADVVLMDDDPRKIALAIRIARRCLAIVGQNIVFALSVKALCLLLVALGFADMWLGIFADVGVMVLAVLNAMRAMIVRKG